MIKYSLKCAGAHEFEAWFASSESYEAQTRERQIACPECGSHDVAKAIMAPHVASHSLSSMGAPTPAAAQAMLVEVVRHVRQTLLAKTEDVGSRFPEEARRIHYGEAESRAIRGEASGEEARELQDEGIEILVIPDLPEDAN